MNFFKSLILSFFALTLNALAMELDTSPSQKGVVASGHALATRAGLEVLNNGGNAFDAAVSVAATLNVVEPMLSGIGGYGSIVIYDSKKKEIRYLNTSGRFPIGCLPDLMRKPTIDFMKNRMGPKSIATPGNLNAWHDMHRQYGVFPWNRLFDKSILIAEKGFKITLLQSVWLKEAFGNFSEYSKSFYGIGGLPLREGDTLIQTDLAKTFRLIANRGPDVFYRGEIAEAIDKHMKKVGSFLSIEDLHRNKAEWGDPIHYNYRGYDVYTAGFPASSFAGLYILGLMQQFKSGQWGHDSPEYQHVLAEILKQSEKARLTYAADPEVQPISVEHILSEKSFKSIAHSISMTQASAHEPLFGEESQNTTHFVVADSIGNIVTATQTLGNGFGSRVMVEGTGIWMNSSMAFSTFEPKGNPMDVFPGRHKLSSDFPTIIMKDGRPWVSLGTPGGHTITQNVPQIILNLIDFKMSLQDAIDSPKLAFIVPDLLQIEKNIPAQVKQSLRQMGHKTKEGDIGNATGIRIYYDTKGKIRFLEPAVDKRRDGHITQSMLSE